MASKTEKRRKLQKKQQAKRLESVAKPHDKLAKDLENIERKYIDREIKQAPTDKELKKARKSGAKGKLTLSEGPKDATKESLKYKKEVLKSKTPKAFPRKPKTPTKRKIKTDRAKLVAKKIGTKALLRSIPVIGAIATLLESKPAYNKGGTVKNYAKGGGVRKAKFTDN